MRIFFIFLFIFWNHTSYGELSSSLKKLLSSLEKTYNDIEDFQADFDQIEVNILGKEKKTSGTIYSLSDGKIFWHTKTHPVFKVISNGKTIWLYYPKDRQLLTESWNNLDSQTKIALLFLKKEGQLEKHFKIRWKDQKQKILELKPKKPMTVEKIFLFLSKEKTFPERIKFFYPLNRQAELILKEIRFNQNLLEKHKQTPLDENINPRFEFNDVEK